VISALRSATDGAAATLAAAIAGAGRVWIGTHVDPDGDALGSALGLAHLLRAAGCAASAHCQDAAPAELAFLPGVASLGAAPPDPARHDLAVALDAADPGRLGALYDAAGWSALPTLVIDHHISNPGYGACNLVDPAASSTAEIVHRLAGLLSLDIPADAATCLLTGVVTDTLGFRTPSTTAATLDAASDLMGRGASLADIAHAVFNSRPLGSLELVGRALARLERRGPFALATLTRADFAALHLGPAEARGIASFLATAAEPVAIAVLRERFDGAVDVSLRAKPGYDLVPVARALGGGGHAAAAGARIDGPLDEASARVFDALAAHAPAQTPAAGGRA